MIQFWQICVENNIQYYRLTVYRRYRSWHRFQHTFLDVAHNNKVRHTYIFFAVTFGANYIRLKIRTPDFQIINSSFTNKLNKIHLYIYIYIGVLLY